MAQAFWKLLPTDLQRHLRVEGNIHSEATFWETRAKQKAMEAKFAEGDSMVTRRLRRPGFALQGRHALAVCHDCRHAENLIKRAR